MVHPSVLALVYLSPTEGGELRYTLSYLEGQQNLALCFECVEGAMPKDRIGRVLRPIYDCYEAETASSRAEHRMDGSPASWDSYGKLSEAFQRKLGVLTKDCIFCDGDPKTGNPFFTARVIDKAACENEPSLFGSYQFSFVEEGMTYFRMCFADFSAHFPKATEELSYGMLGVPNPKAHNAIPEIHFSAEFLKAMEGEGMSPSEITDMFAEGHGDIRIVRREAEEE